MAPTLKQYFDYFELLFHYLRFLISPCWSGPGPVRFSQSPAPVPTGPCATFSCACGQSNTMEILPHKFCMENIEHSNLSSPEISCQFHFPGCQQ